jgi:hypothetical protein
MMDLTLKDLEFNKNDEGVCRASVTINGNHYNIEVDSKANAERQSYLCVSEQITPELKTAFRIASLFFKDVTGLRDFVFTLPYPDDAPELYYNGNTYYDDSHKPQSNNFQDCLQSCINAIGKYHQNQGEQLQYGVSSAFVLS